MANFKPLNNYALFILNKLIEKYYLKPPFLDVACGTGYLSKHLASKGWEGVAIDYSRKAVNITKENLKGYQKVKMEKKFFSKVSGKYNTVLMFDILEHIKDDTSALRKANLLLSRHGHLVIATPSNPKEWRWDDNFYGHFRRYTQNELKEKLIKAGFKPIIFCDYTFPVFWALRRIYTKIISNKKRVVDREKQTEQSSFSYAWNIPIISSILDRTSFLWLPIFIIQYVFFKKFISYGNALIVLAKNDKK
ncbi:class I SAM-dependent methyltransferase [Candidatus Daviesbacteria bacterium]|nr:class I SAM-dependent methyltransferase [Candidatus Daviesbacteria bacterium]